MDRETPPKQKDVLFRTLFEGRDRDTTLAMIRNGISGIIANAGRLLSDMDLLLKENRYSSARFVLTTAKEELGKVYILLDMCRLDFSKYGSVLRRLAQAFYTHETKQAYFDTLSFGALASLEHARRYWDAQVTRWYPPDPEWGQPPMPHDTFYDRELPLYVDIVESESENPWILPSNDYDAHYFGESIGPNRTERIHAVREQFSWAAEQGLFTVLSLRDLNDEFSRHFFTEKSSTRELLRVSLKVATRIDARISLGTKNIMNSVFISWPLYHFAAERL